MSVIQAIKPLISYYEKTGHIQESWMKDHIDSIECHEVEEKIECGLALHQALTCLTDDWNDEKRERWGKDLISVVVGFYSRWISQSEKIRDKIRILEAKGFNVHRADEFRECLAKMKLIPLDVEEYQRLYREADQGGIPLDEAFDELLSGN